MKNNNNILKKITTMAYLLKAKKRKSNGLNYAYYSIEDIRGEVLSQMKAHNLYYESSIKKTKIKRKIVDGKTFFACTVKMAHLIIDVDTGEMRKYNWFGYATDYKDGGRVLSKAVTSSQKSWLTNLLLVSEQHLLTKDEFFTILEGSGIDRSTFRNAMLILNRNSLSVTELENVLNEVLAIKELSKRFLINQDEDSKNRWRNINKENRGIKHHQIAQYLLDMSGKLTYNWPAKDKHDVKIDTKSVINYLSTPNNINIGV